MDLNGAPAAARTRITFIGHSTVLVEDGGTRVLTDPLLRDRVGPLVREREQRGRARELALGRGPLDGVLISHTHRDHFDAPSVRSLGDVRLVVPEGEAQLARRVASGPVEELPVGATTRIGGLEVEAVPAEHAGARNVVGPAVETIGFTLAGAARTYFAGDTDAFDEMDELGEIDVALVPVWGWGTNVGEGHLDPTGAARALARLRPRIAVPIHWGTLHLAGRRRAMDRHLVDPPREFAVQAARAAPEVEVRILEPGQSLEV